jgi:hypothetical protein
MQTEESTTLGGWLAPRPGPKARSRLYWRGSQDGDCVSFAQPLRLTYAAPRTSRRERDMSARYRVGGSQGHAPRSPCGLPSSCLCGSSFRDGRRDGASGAFNGRLARRDLPVPATIGRDEGRYREHRDR